jgi:hypothetical protein
MPQGYFLEPLSSPRFGIFGDRFDRGENARASPAIVLLSVESIRFHSLFPDCCARAFLFHLFYVEVLESNLQ